MTSLATRMFRKLSLMEQPPVVSVLRLNGTIGQTGALRRGLSMAALAEPIDRLFADKTVAAAALVINSPGGSPVQAKLIHDRVRTLAREKGIKVLAFAEDVAASGGYMLLLAGDEVYAHDSSIVGSIGVVSAGFGFEKAIERLGIERRVHIAGERKAMLDPFRPEDPKDVALLAELQKDVHEQFKEMVRARRAGKLNGEEMDLFSGAFWSGGKGLTLGLVDGIGDVFSVARAKFGPKVEFRNIQMRRNWWGLPAPASAGIELPRAGEWASDLIAAAEDRALWSRFGL